MTLKPENPPAPPMTSVDALICAIDENTLLAVVMRLTAGTPNPAVVRAQIKRIRDEIGGVV